MIAVEMRYEEGRGWATPRFRWTWAEAEWVSEEAVNDGSWLVVFGSGLDPSIFHRTDQWEANGYPLSPQKWEIRPMVDQTSGLVTAVELVDLAQQNPTSKVSNVSFEFREPRPPNPIFEIRPGKHSKTIAFDVIGDEDLDEVECPACETCLSPVPEICPECGFKLTIPPLGELVAEFGPDALIGIDVRSMTANLYVTYDLSWDQAKEANKKAQAELAERRTVYKAQKAQWDTLLKPIEDKRKAKAQAEKEARERAEYERLKEKFDG